VIHLCYTTLVECSVLVVEGQTRLPLPNKVVCEGVTAALNSISLRWSPNPEEKITMYFVQYREYHGDGGCNTCEWQEQYCSRADTIPCTIHELMPDTEYELRVVAVNTDGLHSEPSDVVRARTKTALEFWNGRRERLSSARHNSSSSSPEKQSQHTLG
jgi:hypothetical protein